MPKTSEQVSMMAAKCMIQQDNGDGKVFHSPQPTFSPDLHLYLQHQRLLQSSPTFLVVQALPAFSCGAIAQDPQDVPRIPLP